MAVPDRKFSFKSNLILGILFLIAAVNYLFKAIDKSTAFNWFIFISSISISILWFSLSFVNYKKNKEIEKRLNSPANKDSNP